MVLLEKIHQSVVRTTKTHDCKVPLLQQSWTSTPVSLLFSPHLNLRSDVSQTPTSSFSHLNQVITQRILGWQFKGGGTSNLPVFREHTNVTTAMFLLSLSSS